MQWLTDFVVVSIAALAQRERGMIGLRTREGMAQRKAEGQHMDRSVAADFVPTYRRVLDMRAAGARLNAIARALNDEGVMTAEGKTWHASTVRAIVTSETARQL